MSDGTLVSRSLFDSASLRRHVEGELAKVPTGHGSARLRVTLPDGQIEFLVAARVHDRWLIQGKASFTVPTREWGVQVEVETSW